MKKSSLLVPGGLLLSTARPAHADRLDPGVRDFGVVSTIGKGVEELGVETMFVVGYTNTGGTSSLRSMVLGDGVFRYFVIDNLSLTVSLGGFYRSDNAGDVRDDGAFGTVGANYHPRLGGGMLRHHERGFRPRPIDHSC
jgi:hypothetical protein